MTTIEKLLAAVREHSGMDDDQIREAGEHGADAGWPEFTYYADTGRFYDANEGAIWDLLAERADDMGEKNPIALIATFSGAKGCVGDGDQFKNLLAWFALEEVGRYLEDNPEARRGPEGDAATAE